MNFVIPEGNFLRDGFLFVYICSFLADVFVL